MVNPEKLITRAEAAVAAVPEHLPHNCLAVADVLSEIGEFQTGQDILRDAARAIAACRHFVRELIIAQRELLAERERARAPTTDTVFSPKVSDATPVRDALDAEIGRLRDWEDRLDAREVAMATHARDLRAAALREAADLFTDRGFDKVAKRRILALIDNEASHG